MWIKAKKNGILKQPQLAATANWFLTFSYFQLRSVGYIALFKLFFQNWQHCKCLIPRGPFNDIHTHRRFIQQGIYILNSLSSSNISLIKPFHCRYTCKVKLPMLNINCNNQSGSKSRHSFGIGHVYKESRPYRCNSFRLPLCPGHPLDVCFFLVNMAALTGGIRLTL